MGARDSRHSGREGQEEGTKEHDDWHHFGALEKKR
jgi:hypothetical protein